MPGNVSQRIEHVIAKNGAGRVENVANPVDVVDAANNCPNCSTRLKESRCKMKCPQ